MPSDGEHSTPRVLVAGVGNVLRRDDGFGVAVARRLIADGRLPAGVEVIETGIGGMSIVHRLMDGYDALIVVDAVDHGEEAGTVITIESYLAPSGRRGGEAGEWLTNLHLAEPSQVFLLARAIGVLPERVLVIGCQPHDCEGLGEGLSQPVARAVETAARRVLELALALCYPRLSAQPAAVEPKR